MTSIRAGPMPRQNALYTLYEHCKSKALVEDIIPNTILGDDVLRTLEEAQLLDLHRRVRRHGADRLRGLNNPDGIADNSGRRSYIGST